MDPTMKDILQRFSSVEECGDNMESSPGIHIHVNDSSEMAKLIGALTNIDQGGPANAPDEDYTDMDTMLSRGDDLHAMKHPDDIRVKDGQAYDEEAVDEWENSPDGYQGDEEYADHNYMLDKLSGGLNGKKKMHKPAHAGDNPMAVESIKERLSAAYQKKLQEAKRGSGWTYYVDKGFTVDAKFKELPREIQISAEDEAGEPYQPDENVEDIDVVAEIGFNPGTPATPTNYGPPDRDPYDPGEAPEFEVLSVYLDNEDNIDLTHVDSIVQDITNRIDRDPGHYLDDSDF